MLLLPLLIIESTVESVLEDSLVFDISTTNECLKSVFHKKIFAKPFGTQNPQFHFIDFNGAENVNFVCQMHGFARTIL